MPISSARAILSRINRVVDELGDSTRQPSRLELDLLREQVRRFYEAIDEVERRGLQPSSGSKNQTLSSGFTATAQAVDLSAGSTERPLDLGRAREMFSSGSPSTSITARPQPGIIQIPDELEADLRKIEADRLVEQKRQAEAARRAAEQAERDRIAAEAAERERVRQEQVRLDQLRSEQQFREQSERDRLAADQAQRERDALIRAEAQRMEQERDERQRAIADAEARLEREQADREHEAAARAQREAQDRQQLRLAQEQQEQLSREQSARERAAASELQRHSAPVTLVPLDNVAANATGENPMPRALRELFTIERATDLSDRLANSPVPDLNRAMALNDQLLVRNELFGGSQELMNSTLLRLNGLPNYEAAVDLLAEPARQFDWAEEERRPTARTFVKLVRRRYA